MKYDDSTQEENKIKEEAEKASLKSELLASDGLDGFSGNLIERNLGLIEALPNIYTFYTAPTAIVIAFSALVGAKNFYVPLLIEIAFYAIIIGLFFALSTYTGKKFAKIGGYDLIIKPSQKVTFQFTKLFIFLVGVALLPTLVSHMEISIDKIKPIMWAFLGVYFADTILTKIIKHIKENHFYDNKGDKRAQKIMELLELLVCLLSIIAYGLVLFPLSLRNHSYQIAIYFGIIALLAIIFTILDHMIIIKHNSTTLSKEAEDLLDNYVYFDVVNGWKIFAYVSFFLLHAIIIGMAALCWVEV